jgi:hypothetical protein
MIEIQNKTQENEEFLENKEKVEKKWKKWNLSSGIVIVFMAVKWVLILSQNLIIILSVIPEKINTSAIGLSVNENTIVYQFLDTI